MQISRGTIEGLLDLHRLSCEASGEIRRRSESGDISPTDATMEDLTSPAANRFFCVVANLDSEVRAELVALMWLGRDEQYTQEDFPILLDKARKQEWQGDAAYLDEKRHLDEYLVAAMSKMNM
jgi:hypothetical protein